VYYIFLPINVNEKIRIIDVSLMVIEHKLELLSEEYMYAVSLCRLALNTEQWGTISSYVDLNYTGGCMHYLI
jgi:hypothetical protein